MENVADGNHTFLTVANQSHLTEIESLWRRNKEFHQPWVYHGDIKPYAEKLASNKTIGLLVWAKQGSWLIGIINLNEPVRGALQSAYLGYFVDEKFAGRGYMTEGLKLACNHAFDDLNFHRLEANIQPGNVQSIALVKKLGFRREGFSPKYLRINNVWCDHERWAILADERDKT